MKKIYTIVLWIIGCLYHLPVCKAQCNEFTIYTTQSGLSGNEMYTFPVMDKAQQLWMCINSNKVNVLRDGRVVKTWGQADGFIDDHIVQIHCDKQGRVWCVNGDKGISVVEKGVVRNFKIGETLTEKEGIVGIGDWLGKACVFAPNGAFYTYNGTKLLKSDSKLPFVTAQTTLWKILQGNNADEIYFFLKNPEKNYLLRWKADKRVDSIDLPTPNAIWKWIHGNVVGYLPAKSQILTLVNQQWLTNPVSKKVEVLSSDDNQLFFKAKIDDVITTVYEWSAAAALKKQFSVRYNYELKGVTQDKSGLFWVSTTNGLLRIFPNMFHYNASDHRVLDEVQSICGDKQHKIWFGSYSKGFSFLSPTDDYTIQTDVKTNRYKKVMPSNMLLRDGRMLFFIENERGILASDGSNWQLHPFPTTGFYFSQSRDGRLLLGTVNGLAIGQGTQEGALASNWRFLGEQKGYPFTNVLTVTEDWYGRIWMGRLNHGFAVYLPERDTILNWSVTSKDPQSFGLGSSVCDYQGNLWLGGLHGLHFLRNSQDLNVADLKFEDFKKVAKIVIGDKKVYSLQIYKKNYLIIGTEKGFGILNLEHFYLGKQPQLLFFNNANGFSSESCEQNAIWVDSFRVGKGWIGHDKGATLVDFDQIIAHFAPFSVGIDTTQMRLQKVRLKGTLLECLEQNQAIQLCFSSNTKNIVGLYYKIDNIGAFVYTPEAHFDLPNNLSSGLHSIQITAISADGNVCAETEFGVQIPYVWYLMWEYWVIASFFVVTMAYIVAKQRIAKRKKELEQQQARERTERENEKIKLENEMQQERFEMEKEKLEQEKQIESEKNDNLRLKIASSQLNPHFLGSFTRVIESQFRKLGDAVGVDFAHKMNNIVTSAFQASAGKAAYTLEKELEITRDYLNVAKKLYDSPKKEAIRYQIKEDEIKHLYKLPIPLFQIQLHCENAVEHGIKNTRYGKGSLEISFLETPDYLFIYIQDDGIGRPAAKLKVSTGMGQGVKTLAEIHQILNLKNSSTGLEIRQDYEDNIFNQSFGTKVIIQLPKSKDFNHGI
jgi:sensor histidine kinase YesM/ligand-binding sensor domain-containing protein